MQTVTLTQLARYKKNSERFACLTCYDASFTQVLNAANIDVILVGDTLGEVIQGHTTTVPVTVDAIVYHVSCVARTNQRALLIGDMPFLSYANQTDALHTAQRLMQAGAHMVKLEGHDWTCDMIAALTERGIPVCAHIGLTPQSVHAIGGYKIQGKQPEQAKQLQQTALALQRAGARLLVLECIPYQLAGLITETLTIPTIGIGAGPLCDGQILVLYDMLGLSQRTAPKFVKNFLAETTSIQAAITAYATAVKQQTFPTIEHCYDTTSRA